MYMYIHVYVYIYRSLVDFLYIESHKTKATIQEQYPDFVPANPCMNSYYKGHYKEQFQETVPKNS
jgi:hypothetical protein